MSQSPAGIDRQSVVQFMTTEHFTLQTARATANAEISSRLQLYMTTLSSTIIALALVAQLSELGRAFVAFALVLLPVVYFLGVATLVRVTQASAEWRVYGQGMNRIRHYYLEVAPELRRYFVLPATDDPWVSLAAIGIQGRAWWHGLLTTAPAMVVIVNSVLAGVFAGVLAAVVGPSGPVLPAVSAAVGFALSVLVLWYQEQRSFHRDMAAAPVAFAADRAED